MNEVKVMDKKNFGKFINKGSYGRVYEYGDDKIIKWFELKNQYGISLDILNELVVYKTMKNHPNIGDLLEIGVTKNFETIDGMYFIMPKYEEINIESLSIIDKIKIGREVLLTLKDMHNFNIFHRDLKVANILYDKKFDRYKLIDFGLSRHQLHIDKFDTYVYTSPYRPIELNLIYLFDEFNEYIIDKKLFEKCEVWAFGMMFYQILCGKTILPYTNTKFDESIEFILNNFPNKNIDNESDIQMLIKIYNETYKFTPKKVSRKLFKLKLYRQLEQYTKHLTNDFVNLFTKIFVIDPVYRISLNEILKDFEFLFNFSDFLRNSLWFVNITTIYNINTNCDIIHNKLIDNNFFNLLSYNLSDNDKLKFSSTLSHYISFGKNIEQYDKQDIIFVASYLTINLLLDNIENEYFFKKILRIFFNNHVFKNIKFSKYLNISIDILKTLDYTLI